MSDTLVWRDDCPDDYKVQYWLEDGVIQVQCVSMDEPPPQHTSGTTIIRKGDHIFKIEWGHDGEDLSIVDLDMVISLDDEIG